MTTIGEAFIEVHADTDEFPSDLERDLKAATKRAEKNLDKAGQDFGDKVSDSMAKRIGQRGKDFGRAVERATRNVTVRVRSTIRFDRVRDSIRRFFRRDVGNGISDEIGQALDRASRRGGPLSKLSEGIADAIGAGFNVSGRSPLIGILLPALAALIGVIVAAAQAVNALVAVLTIIPGLLASIGLQAGVLVIAFNGMGTAIQKAFAAKNAKELQEALKGLTPSAQSFVRSLLPLRDLFREIGRTVQERFFNRLGGIIAAIQKSLGPSLVSGFGDVAAAFGGFFRAFGQLLASPGFKNFFNKLVPATVRWIDKFGNSLFGRRGFVTAILNMATALMPFMEVFGDILLRNLDRFSGLLFQLANNPGTQKWLDDMAATLQLVFDLLFEVGEFLFVFLKGLNDAGAANTITVLMEALNELMFVLASPVGQKALQGLVDLGIIGIKAFTGLIIMILGALAVLEVFGEWFRVTAGPFVLDVLRAIGQAAVDMATFIGVWAKRIIGAIVGFFVWLWGIITTTKNNFSSLTKGATDMGAKVLGFFKGLPKQISNALGGLGGLLINAGRSLIQGLIDGIRAMIAPLLNLLNWIADRIGGVFGHSPAIYGPLKGKGWTTYRGESIMKGLIEGIESQIPALRETTMNATSNIVFGRDSVQVNFQGAQPTEAQARTVGAAVGQGAANFIAARNTRLVVRTL